MQDRVASGINSADGMFPGVRGRLRLLPYGCQEPVFDGRSPHDSMVRPPETSSLLFPVE